MKCLLVPLDGSLLAEGALGYAERLARPGAATIVLLRAVRTGTAPPDRREAERHASADASRYLDELATRLRARGLAVETVAPSGDAARSIVGEAARRQADLIVMTTHGRGGLGRLLHGSVARAVLDLGTTPILLVRAGEPPLVEGHLRLLTPLDGSEPAEEALALALRIARDHGGTVRLVRVVPLFEPALLGEGYPIGVLDATADRDEARRYLDTVAARVGDTGVPVETAVRLGDPATEINAEVRAADITMIVMTTQSRPGLERVLFGSVADSILKRVKLPLLLVRPAQLGAPAA